MLREEIMTGKLVITGHRPNRIPDEKKTREMIREVLHELQPQSVYQGMAAGVDVWTAAEAWREKIPFESVFPWKGHRTVPQLSLDWLIKNALEVHVLNQAESYPGAFVYESRNRWMIDRSEVVLAVWDGIPKGGTFNAIKYARELGLPIHRINPLKHTYEIL